jgi:hypothetical protein
LKAIKVKSLIYIIGASGKIEADGILKFFSKIGLSTSDTVCGYLMYIMRALNDS